MGHIDKKPIVLSPEHTTFVEGAVSSGEFRSPSDVVEAALQEWKERRENFGHTIGELRTAIKVGIESGPSLAGPTFMEKLIEKHDRSAAASAETK